MSSSSDDYDSQNPPQRAVTGAKECKQSSEQAVATPSSPRSIAQRATPSHAPRRPRPYTPSASLPKKRSLPAGDIPPAAKQVKITDFFGRAVGAAAFPACISDCRPQHAANERNHAIASVACDPPDTFACGRREAPMTQGCHAPDQPVGQLDAARMKIQLSACPEPNDSSAAAGNGDSVSSLVDFHPDAGAHPQSKQATSTGGVGPTQGAETASGSGPHFWLPDGIVPHEKGKSMECSNPHCPLKGAHKSAPKWVAAMGGQRWCHNCKKPGMFRCDKDMPSRRCAVANCPTTPCCGWPGKPDTHCTRHALTGMVNPQLVNPTTCRFCSRAGCRSYPAWGYPGEGWTRCTQHKRRDMSRRGYVCSHTGCDTRACWSEPGERPTRCGAHRGDGYLPVWRLCSDEDCGAVAKWGIPGEKPSWCTAHRSDEHVRRFGACSHSLCLTVGTFRHPGGSEVYCTYHKEDGMVTFHGQLCLVEGCGYRAQWGPPGQRVQRCSGHALPGHVRSINACSQCQQMCAIRHPQQPDLCRRCFSVIHPRVPLSSERKKVREIAVIEQLKEEMPDRCPDVDWSKAVFDKGIAGGKSRKRPDVYLDCGAWALAFEVDERQHKGRSYGKRKETARKEDLRLDAKKPLWLIRFNPDDFTLRGKHHKSCFYICREKGEDFGKMKVRDKEEWFLRLTVAFEKLEEAATTPPPKTPDGVKEVFLFFDEE